MSSATNLADENDFIVACQNICEADDGTGAVVDRDGDPLNDPSNSMVELVDDSVPIPLVEWQELEGMSVPVSAIDIVDITYLGGTQDRWDIDVQLDSWAPEGQGSVASALANRLQDILNYNNFASEGLDVSRQSTSRGRNPADNQGAKRVSYEVTFRLRR